MSLITLALGFLFSIPVGCLIGWGFYKVARSRILRRAEAQAAELIETAADGAELIDIELKEKAQEIDELIWTKEEKGILSLENNIEELQELVEEKTQKNNQKLQSIQDKNRNYEEGVKNLENKFRSLTEKYQDRQAQLKTTKDQITNQLFTKLGLAKKEVVADIVQELENDAHSQSKKIVQLKEQEAKEHSESIAKEILNRALLRFHRPYCPERGIPSVYFEEENHRRILCDAKGDNVKFISELTGCDVIVEEGKTLVAVLGFDPVRRELTRRILERILKEKKPVNRDFIQRAHDNIKRELLATIKRDGDSLAKELRLDNLHPEIRQMMGSLRYRYSFTQNQHFHCGEVGWLCGLLAQELGGIQLRQARRSGMLHDLGKSLDHEMDGGHAVIGANFIQERGEKPEIVHAVRAHHYDEQPSSDMAYLVIAADAISGARPGARRSTVESYEQKVNDLETIAKSFDGVTDCFVLNGGRELRVLVNSKILDDQRSLIVGREMATRIENECSYPGQIKVVIVRETHAYETTRAY